MEPHKILLNNINLVRGKVALLEFIENKDKYTTEFNYIGSIANYYNLNLEDCLDNLKESLKINTLITIEDEID